MTDQSPGKRRTSCIYLCLACFLFAASLLWCVACINEPGRLLFLPLGDVAGGFRSWNGHLEWIEYAGWEQNPDYPMWSVPWWLVLAAEGVVVMNAAQRYHGSKSWIESLFDRVDPQGGRGF